MRMLEDLTNPGFPGLRPHCDGPLSCSLVRTAGPHASQRGRLQSLTILPEEVLFFGGRRVGLAQRFLDFQSWVAKLAPVVLNVIREQGPDRQSLDSDLLAEIADEVLLPAWLDLWHLSVALKQANELQY